MSNAPGLVSSRTARVLPTVSPAVSAAELRRLVTKGRDLAVVDVRATRVHAAGHLAGSLSVPLEALDQRIRTAVPDPSTPLVLASEPDLDARAARVLKALGYTDVAVLEGGLGAWAASGESLVRSPWSRVRRSR